MTITIAIIIMGITITSTITNISHHHQPPSSYHNEGNVYSAALDGFHDEGSVRSSGLDGLDVAGVLESEGNARSVGLDGLEDEVDMHS